MTDIWHEALKDLQTKVSTHNYESWFKDIRFHHQDDKHAYLEVGDDFLKAWIEDNYCDLIESSLSEASGQALKAVIEVTGTYDAMAHEVELYELPVAARSARLESTHSVLDTHAFHERSNPIVPIIDSTVTSTDISKQLDEAGLNARYNFDEYVVGPSNQFCYAACNAVANAPGECYNPLFIFGGVGLGKTHLLHAVGIEVLRQNPNARIVKLSAEEFMNQLITSLRNKDMNSFRLRFRNNCDVLLIDDIQFIGGKDSTQEEFFHTFNALHNSGMQIVITSDKAPKDLPGIEERLASRFVWGLTADIQPPEIETRLAILGKKAELDGIELHKDVAMLLASHVRTNVRELEGTLMRLGAHSKLLGAPITVDFVRRMLKRMNIEQGSERTTEQIIRLACQHFEISISEIKSSKRTRTISQPRQIAMYLARKHTEDSLPEIGRKFGGKDHTTVLAAQRRVEQSVYADEPYFVHAIEAIESQLLV